MQGQGQEQEQGVRVFPNPASDKLNFVLPGTAGPYPVDVFGADGRMYISARKDEQSIDVSSLPAGVYALRVNGSTVRFVKN